MNAPPQKDVGMDSTDENIGFDCEAGYESLPEIQLPSCNDLNALQTRRTRRQRTIGVSLALCAVCLLGVGYALFPRENPIRNRLDVDDGAVPRLAVDGIDESKTNASINNPLDEAPYQVRLIVPTYVAVMSQDVDQDEPKIIGWVSRDVVLPLDPREMAPADQSHLTRILFEPNVERGIEL